MAPPRVWADLPPELLLCITGRLRALRCYLAARAVCTAWRSALPPASPYLLYAYPLNEAALAASLPLGRMFHLAMVGRGSVCVGSGDGCLVFTSLSQPRVLLMNPITGQELALPFLPWPRRHDQWPLFSSNVIVALRPGMANSTAVALPWHTSSRPWPFWEYAKVVFAPNPSKEDFTVVAACGKKTLAYISAGDTTWSYQEIAGDAELADVVYHNGGSGGRKFYCLTTNGDVQVVHVPRGRQTKPVLEPLLDESTGVSPNIFASPYAMVSKHTSAKNLVFCEDTMYQICRNTGGAIDLQLPGGGSLHVSKNEVSVMRYAPARRPCWEAVEDLDGHSVFVGLNNAMSVRGERVPGLKGNCVYWVSQFGNMFAAFDMETRRATPCLHLQESPVCWYLLGDMASSNKKDGEVLHEQQRRGY